MNYKNLILESFNDIGFKPINNQVSDIEKILPAYIDEGFKNVVLSAPTGSGKTLLGIVTSVAINKLLNKENNLKSLVLMHNNMLVDQYHKTFDGNKKFWQVLGNKNYDCHMSPMPNSTADDCLIEFLTSKESCKSCLYFQNKVVRNEIEHLITNFSYYFTISNSPVEILKKRFVNIWDEAHTINDVFVDQTTLVFNEDTLSRIIRDAEELQLSSVQNIRGIFNIIKTNKFRASFLKELLKEFSLQIDLLSQIISEEMSDAYDSGKKEKYIKYKRLNNKYNQLSQIISNYNIEDFEFAIQQEDKSVTLKPIFAKYNFWMINQCEYSLFMSATVSKEYLNQTIGIGNDVTKEIKLDSIFNPEHKKFIYIKPINLNNESLKNDSTINHIISVCDNVIKFHAGEKGIILTPSFNLTSIIANKLRRYGNIIEHKQKTKVIDSIEEFKNSESGVLVSPSIFEGLSLDDDLCRFQILIKAPFPNLIDKRIAYIADQYPVIYKLMTLNKIIQGAGRAVRNIDDYAVTYAVDLNIKKLFESELNIWYDEFHVMEI